MRLSQKLKTQRSFWIIVVLAQSCVISESANLLVNPGFESALTAWQIYGPNSYSLTSASIAHSGTNYYKLYQAFTGSVNYNGIYQDHISGPGAVYSASAWAYTSSGDALA